LADGDVLLEADLLEQRLELGRQVVVGCAHRALDAAVFIIEAAVLDAAVVIAVTIAVTVTVAVAVTVAVTIAITVAVSITVAIAVSVAVSITAAIGDRVGRIARFGAGVGAARELHGEP
jgi:hypothetical protein